MQYADGEVEQGEWEDNVFVDSVRLVTPEETEEETAN